MASTEATATLPAQLARITAPWLTTDELAWIALALWGVLAMLLLVGLLSNGDATRRLMRGMAAITAVELLAVTVFWTARTMTRSGQGAVMVAPGAELRSGPGASFAVRTTLPAGAEVVAAETRVVVGWMPTASVASAILS